jgi:hypothetical protein
LKRQVASLEYFSILANHFSKSVNSGMSEAQSPNGRLEGSIVTEGTAQWNERYYVLDPLRRELEYFTDRKQEELRGVFALDKPFEIENIPPRDSGKRQNRVDLIAHYTPGAAGGFGAGILGLVTGDAGKRTVLKISFHEASSKEEFLDTLGSELWRGVRRNTTTMKYLDGCLCGPFSKESSGDKRWQQRFFVLNPKQNTFSYFADATLSDLKHKAPLVDLQVEDVPERGGTNKKPHRINVKTKEMKLKISLGSAKEKQMLLDEFRSKWRNSPIVTLYWFKSLPESKEYPSGGLHGWVEYSDDSMVTGLLGHSWETKLVVFDSKTLKLKRFRSGERHAPADGSTADGSRKGKRPEAEILVKGLLEKAEGRLNQAVVPLVGTGSAKKARRVDIEGADGSLWSLALFTLNDKTLLLEQIRDAIAADNSSRAAAVGRASGSSTVSMGRRRTRAVTLFQGMVQRDRAGTGSGKQRDVELKVLVLKGCVQIGMFRSKRKGGLSSWRSAGGVYSRKSQARDSLAIDWVNMSLWSDNVATVTTGKQPCVLKWQSRGNSSAKGNKEQFEQLVIRERDHVEIIQKSEVRSPTNSLPAGKADGLSSDAVRAVLDGLNHLKDMSSFDEDLEDEDEEPFAIVHTPYAGAGGDASKSSEGSTVLVFRAGPDTYEDDSIEHGDSIGHSRGAKGKLQKKTGSFLRVNGNWASWSTSKSANSKANVQSPGMDNVQEVGGAPTAADGPTTLGEWLHVFDKQLHDVSHKIKEHRIKNSEHYSSFHRKRLSRPEAVRSSSLDSVGEVAGASLGSMVSSAGGTAGGGGGGGGNMGGGGGDGPGDDDSDDEDLVHNCTVTQITRLKGRDGRGGRGSKRRSGSSGSRSSGSRLNSLAVNGGDGGGSSAGGAGGAGGAGAAVTCKKTIAAKEGEHIIGGRDAQTLREEGIDDQHLMQCPPRAGDDGGGSGVSRLHFEVFYSRDSRRFWLNDVHSKNGTYVRLPEQDPEDVIHKNKFDWSKMHLLVSGYAFKVGELEFEVVWEKSLIPPHTGLTTDLDNRRHKKCPKRKKEGERVFFGELRTKPVGAGGRSRTGFGGGTDDEYSADGAGGTDSAGSDGVAAAAAGGAAAAAGGGAAGGGGGRRTGSRTHSMGARTNRDSSQRPHGTRQASLPAYKRPSLWSNKGASGGGSGDGGSSSSRQHAPKLVLRCTRVPKHKDAKLLNWTRHTMLHKEIEVDDRPEGIILGEDASTYCSRSSPDLDLHSTSYNKNHIHLEGSRPVAPQHCMIRYDEVHGFCLIAFDNPNASGTWVRLDPWKAAFPLPENQPEEEGLVFEVDSGENLQSRKDKKLREGSDPLQYRCNVHNGGNSAHGGGERGFMDMSNGLLTLGEEAQVEEEVEVDLGILSADWNDIIGGAPPAAMSDKFSFGKIKTGTAKLAAHGLADYMGIDNQKVGEIMQQGLAAIRFEFEAHGTTEEVALMNYVLDEKAVEIKEDVSYGTAVRDKGNTGKGLAEFVGLPDAVQAKLEAPHVAALRLYTSQAYPRINNPLREGCSKDRPHPFAATTLFLDQALKKLRANNARGEGEEQQVRKVFWRGMKDLELTDEFRRHGGTELGCMSTSKSMETVAGYANSTKPLVFRVVSDDFMSCGADIRQFSLYPEEAEVLYPPLTYLKVVKTTPIKNSTGIVVDVEPTFAS